MSITPNNPADFSPSMSTYTGQGNFRFWCQVAMPLVYDDSLSYYELLCKMVTYLNNVINDVSATESNVDKLKTAYDELQGYVNDYFATLDVQEEINNKLDVMATDGSLTVLLDPLVTTEVGEWLTTHLTPTTPAIDNSLKVSGAGADSKTVGDILFRDNTHDTGNNLTDVISLPLVKQPYATSATAFSDLKIYNQYYISGTNLRTLFAPYQNQESTSYHIPNYDKIVGAGNYIILKINPYARTSNGYMVFIMSQSGGIGWVGYKTNNASPITYEDVEYDAITFSCPIAPLDSTLSQENEAANAKAVGDAFDSVLNVIYRGNPTATFTARVPLYTTTYASINSLDNIPQGTYGTLTGSHLLELIPNGENVPVFPARDKIVSGSTYVLYKIPLTRASDSVYYITSLAGTYIWQGYKILDNVGWGLINQPKDLILPEIKRYCYTNLDKTIEGAYATDGSIVTTDSHALRRSQMLRVNPNEKVFLGYKLQMTTSSKSVAVATCFDKYFNLISCISHTDLTDYAPINIESYNPANNYYPCPDGKNNSSTQLSSYATMYYFTTPANCYYICVPTLDSPSFVYDYRYMVSNCDSFRLGGSQNIEIYNGNYSKLDKKLCVIGPSTVMIDRLLKNMNESQAGSSAKNQYVCGFQEYLKPYYKEVRSYGYSGSAYYSNGSFVGYMSIYDMITEGVSGAVNPPDLSGYDEFILLPNTNGMTNLDKVGTYDSIDETTYFGALNLIIQEIRNANPYAIIYTPNAATFLGQNPQYMYQLVDALNEEYDKLCSKTSCILIDSCKEMGIGVDNRDYFTYDNTHYNQEGNKLYGEFLVRKMCM